MDTGVVSWLGIYHVQHFDIMAGGFWLGFSGIKISGTLLLCFDLLYDFT